MADEVLTLIAPNRPEGAMYGTSLMTGWLMLPLIHSAQLQHNKYHLWHLTVK